MQTYLFGSRIVGAAERDGFDYLDLAIKGNMRPALRSVGGVSGAALWRCNLKRSPMGVEGDHYALEGVAFYEEIDAEGSGFIRCHGRGSIYRQALGRSA